MWHEMQARIFRSLLQQEYILIQFLFPVEKMNWHFNVNRQVRLIKHWHICSIINCFLLIMKKVVFLLKSECEQSNFGLDCKERCSGHCINNVPCDHVSGVCHGGCQDGYHGARCFNCKKLISVLVKCILNITLYFSKSLFVNSSMHSRIFW